MLPPDGPQGQPPIQPQPGQPVAGPPVSPDGRFIWNGYQWVPVVPQTSGASTAVIVVLGGCLALIVLSVLVIVVLTVVGKQVNNTFSNVSNGIYYAPSDTPVVSNGLGS